MEQVRRRSSLRSSIWLEAARRVLAIVIAQPAANQEHRTRNVRMSRRTYSGSALRPPLEIRYCGATARQNDAGERKFPTRRSPVGKGDLFFFPDGVQRLRRIVALRRQSSPPPSGCRPEYWPASASSNSTAATFALLQARAEQTEDRRDVRGRQRFLFRQLRQILQIWRQMIRRSWLSSSRPWRSYCAMRSTIACPRSRDSPWTCSNSSSEVARPRSNSSRPHGRPADPEPLNRAGKRPARGHPLC